ncbi:MAG: hypothetical protein JXB49_00150 [Bacteroidales bacterium]|nr:hypothetical protein [Bacteroidales bacterium]
MKRFRFFKKNYYKHFFQLTLLLVIIGFISCETEDDDFGDPRESIEGSWICSENSQSFGTSSYTVYIDPDPDDSTAVRIENFYNLTDLNAYIYAKMNGNILTLKSQAVSARGSNWIIKSGTGIISNNKKEIEWEYQIDDGSGEIDYVEATYTRQY